MPLVSEFLKLICGLSFRYLFNKNEYGYKCLEVATVDILAYLMAHISRENTAISTSVILQEL